MQVKRSRCRSEGLPQRQAILSRLGLLLVGRRQEGRCGDLDVVFEDAVAAAWCSSIEIPLFQNLELR